MRGLFATTAVAAILLAGCVSDPEPQETVAQDPHPLDLESNLEWFECLQRIDPNIDAYNEVDAMRERYPDEVAACDSVQPVDPQVAHEQFVALVTQELEVTSTEEVRRICRGFDEGGDSFISRLKSGRWGSLAGWSDDTMVDILTTRCDQLPQAEPGHEDAPLAWGEYVQLGSYEITVTNVILDASAEEVSLHTDDPWFDEGWYVIVELSGTYNKCEGCDDEYTVYLLQTLDVHFNEGPSGNLMNGGWVYLDSDGELALGDEFTARVAMFYSNSVSVRELTHLYVRTGYGSFNPEKAYWQLTN